MILDIRSCAIRKPARAIGSLAFSAMLVCSGTWAQEPTRLLWGDTHLHSSYSVDAYIAGNRTADPDVAYRYAKGEPVVHPYNRTRVQILEPLDFLSVSDHAEYLGIVPVVMSGEFEQPEANVFQKIKSWIMIRILAHAIEDPLEGTKYFTGFLPMVGWAAWGSLIKRLRIASALRSGQNPWRPRICTMSQGPLPVLWAGSGHKQRVAPTCTGSSCPI